MKLIIEAGSTKTDLVIFDESRIEKISLNGINPTSNPGSECGILGIPDLEYDEIIECYYYGAGVSVLSASDKVKKVLAQAFTQSRRIRVNTDLVAAIRSFNTREKHIIIILGTGTNVALVEDGKIVQNVPAPGYLFDDYGSGYYLGKILLNEYIFGKMSREDNALFKREYLTIIDKLLPTIYNAPRINSKVAAFSMFLNICSKELRESCLKRSIENLIKYRIQFIEKSSNYKLKFVGSIAYSFQNEIKRFFNDHGYEVVDIKKSPLEGLIAYHRNN